VAISPRKLSLGIERGRGRRTVVGPWERLCVKNPLFPQSILLLEKADPLNWTLLLPPPKRHLPLARKPLNLRSPRIITLHNSASLNHYQHNFVSFVIILEGERASERRCCVFLCYILCCLGLLGVAEARNEMRG